MQNTSSDPEVWAGIECTINRVGDRYFDQLQGAGCYEREGDIKQLAQAGVRTLRFPVLWEKHEPRENMEIDWRWTDARMNEMRAYGITPVVTLVHHGSGPGYTNLCDKEFAGKLARFAKKVAGRYPWVTHYTPVNEPLTTARFSGLYALWYPHLRSDADFCRMLINQVRAVVSCVEIIRTVTPHAQLVQTEDLAKIHSTPVLKYQRDFENNRRWLSYDLLCGNVDRSHALYPYLLQNGITKRELAFFIRHRCRPDIAGFNYYITSERWLDHRIDRYPLCTHGSNGKHAYADTEAVRAYKVSGLQALLTEAWKRFQLPIALTEIHIGCTREEQLRWFRDAWQTAKRLNKKGVEIKAVTLWSVLGSFDWNSLLTKQEMMYEQGAFDIRTSSNNLRKTALALVLKDAERDRILSHPAIAGNGWWQTKKTHPTMRRPLLILGSTGTLGSAFGKICDVRNLRYISLSRREFDLTDPSRLQLIIETVKPWAVINATGYVSIDNAEKDPAGCYAINTDASASIARICARYDLPLVSFSSDQVFAGDKQLPYTEGDKIQPLNVYGHSKALAEQQIMQAHKQALVIRTSAFFGPWDKYNFAYDVLEQLAAAGSFTVMDKGTVSPTYVPDLVNATLDLLIDSESGIWHLSNCGALSWHDFARAIAERGGHSAKQIYLSGNENLLIAKRPAYSALTSHRGLMLPTLDKAMHSFFTQRS